jgi:hypothetical protein
MLSAVGTAAAAAADPSLWLASGLKALFLEYCNTLARPLEIPLLPDTLSPYVTNLVVRPSFSKKEKPELVLSTF